MSEESVDMLVAMVKPYVDHHRLDALFELGVRARRLKTAEDALERWRNGELDGEAAMVAIRYALHPFVAVSPDPNHTT